MEVRENLNRLEKTNADIATIFRMVPSAINEHLKAIKDTEEEFNRMEKNHELVLKKNLLLTKKLSLAEGELETLRKIKEDFNSTLEGMTREISEKDSTINKLSTEEVEAFQKFKEEHEKAMFKLREEIAEKNAIIDELRAEVINALNKVPEVVYIPEKVEVPQVVEPVQEVLEKSEVSILQTPILIPQIEIPKEVNGVTFEGFHLEKTPTHYRFGMSSKMYKLKHAEVEQIISEIPEDFSTESETYGSRRRIGSIMRLLYLVYGGTIYSAKRSVTHYKKP
jgi:DNA repair exonuclease SbcCD ATPase subunit